MRVKKGEPNTFCSDIGKDNLDGPIECIRAALKFGIRDFVHLLFNDTEYPAACFRKISDNTAYWNPATVGSRNPDAEPLCGDNGNYTIPCFSF